MRKEEIVARAQEARREAYAPYSRFAVGAALLTKSGQIYTGCNVENASYGLAVCAERVAVFQAVAAGEREFEAIAVVSETKATPCGSCRQVLAEFDPGEMRVLVADLEGRYEEYRLKDLLPWGFSVKHLPRFNP